MKIEVSAGILADALATAASAVAIDASTKKIGALNAVHIATHRETVNLSVNALDRYVSTSCPAAVDQAGGVAVAADRLTDLVGGFAKDANIKLVSDDGVLAVRSDRSNYKLSALPLENLPAAPCIDDAPLGETELDAGQALRIFERPLFCANTERTRLYLNGVFLHNLNDELVAVGTDGNRLARVAVGSAINSLSSDRRLVVPLASVKPLIKLLRRASGLVRLLRSRTLFEVRMEKFSFVSKLIDSDFPSYERLIPPDRLPNIATIERVALVQALTRLKAVGEARSAIGLVWDSGATEMRVPLIRERDSRERDCQAAVEELPGDLTGSARVAVSLPQLLELCEEMTGENLLIECDGLGAIRVTSPDDESVLILQMPLRVAIDEEEGVAA
jgi:DNA polymerase III subunit beta